MFGTAAIKTFLNSFLMENNTDYKRMWNLVKYLALKEHHGFGANLSGIVKQIESNETWIKDMEQSRGNTFSTQS